MKMFHIALRPCLRAGTAAALVMIAASAAAKAAETVPVPGDLQRGSAMTDAVRIGRLDAAKPMQILITLPLSKPIEARSFAARVSRPGDPLYRHYLNPADFAARYGASKSDYDAIVAWAKSNNLTPGAEYETHTVLPISGTVADIEHALGTTFSNFQSKDGRQFFNADAEAALPIEIAGRVESVIGLSSFHRYAPLLQRRPANTAPLLHGGAGPYGGMTPAQIRTAYSVPAAPSSPAGEVAAVFEQGGFDPTDITTFEARYKLPAVPVTVRSVDGYGGGIDDRGVELEAVLDIDTLIGVNPALSKILVYEAGVTEDFGAALVHSFAAMAHDDKAQTISVSYGLDEALMTKATMKAEDTQLTQLVAQGQGVYVSAGDYGAYGDEGNGLNVSDPASQPNVVSVGGTTLYLTSQNRDLYEVVWNTLAGTGSATGGGVSTIWPIPGYQTNYGAPNFTHIFTVYGGSATMRNMPDVSAVADPITGASVYSRINGGWGVVGGTSLSAPLMAAVGTIGNTESKSLGFNQIGFANPAIYAVMETPLTNALVQNDFHDIVDGNNGNIYLFNNVPGFTSGYSYDLASGWGTPNTPSLLLDMALQPVIKNVSPPSPATKITLQATATTIKVGWEPAADATGYFVLAYALLPGTDPAVPYVATGNSVLLSGLIPNLEYEIAVYSVGPHGYTQSGTYFVVTDKKSS